MELTCGPTKVTVNGRGERDQAPRPWVPATRVREGSWSLRESTATLGRAVPRVFQVQTEPVQDPWNAPRSVAAWIVPGTSGSTTRSLTGMFGRSVALGDSQ